jgi:prevent-host-death family protein
MKLLDEVERTGQPLVITKHGKPVARLESEKKRRDLKGSVTFNVSDEELIYASMGPWDMERD